MMRIRGSFSLYKRRMRSGLVVFYYRTYTERGERTCGHSTGQSTKTAAKEYCNTLLRDGKIIPQARVKMPSFAEFAAGWWEYESCPYLQKRKARRKISRGYAQQGKSSLRVYLLPVFGKYQLDEIRVSVVDSWLSSMPDKGFSNNTANSAFKILKVMLGEAAKAGHIAVNPCDTVEMLPPTEKKIDILRPDEIKKLFPLAWSDVWKSELFCIFFKLAACTGMRIGELRGLRGEYVFDGYIEVRGQHGRFGYTDTKNHKPRTIPVSKMLEHDLKYLKELNSMGYLFSDNDGKSPVSRNRLYAALFTALDTIGIDEAERKRRKLSVHGFRHFFNTTLLMANIADSKVREMTGHSSEKMTKVYTHFDTTQFTEVIEVQ